MSEIKKDDKVVIGGVAYTLPPCTKPDGDHVAIGKQAATTIKGDPNLLEANLVCDGCGDRIKVTRDPKTLRIAVTIVHPPHRS